LLCRPLTSTSFSNRGPLPGPSSFGSTPACSSRTPSFPATPCPGGPVSQPIVAGSIVFIAFVEFVYGLRNLSNFLAGI